MAYILKAYYQPRLTEKLWEINPEIHHQPWLIIWFYTAMAVASWRWPSSHDDSEALDPLGLRGCCPGGPGSPPRVASPLRWIHRWWCNKVHLKLGLEDIGGIGLVSCWYDSCCDGKAGCQIATMPMDAYGSWSCWLIYARGYWSSLVYIRRVAVGCRTGAGILMMGHQEELL